MNSLTVKKCSCLILREPTHGAGRLGPEPMALATGGVVTGGARVAGGICLGLVVLLGVMFCQPVFGEGPVKMDIALGTSALKDPLIEVVLPPKESRDTLSFQNEGMLIQQFPDQPGVKTGVAGLKLLSNVEGDFSFQIDFDLIQLAKPKKGWGQGLVIRILTDDQNSPIMAFGCVATLQKDRM